MKSLLTRVPSIYSMKSGTVWQWLYQKPLCRHHLDGSMYPPEAEFIRAMEGKKERKGRREGRRKEERKGRRRERKKKVWLV